MKIENAWVVDPLVTRLDVDAPPQLYIQIDEKLPEIEEFITYDSASGQDEWLHAVVSPLRGYWLYTDLADGLGPRGSFTPATSHILNSLPEVERPLMKVYVREPDGETTGWFLDLEHARRMVRKYCPNTILSVWLPWAEEGIIEWVPADITPVCKWNIGSDTDPVSCSTPASFTYAGRPAALCRKHKQQHDAQFAVDRISYDKS